MPFSANSIVATIWEARKSKLPDEMISAQLAKMGLTPEQTAHVFEMVEFSLNRAFMETLGGSHTADYDADPYFRASLIRARQKFPPSHSVRRERTVIAVAVGVAVCVGVLAVGVVVYYAIDLLRASH